MENLDFSVVRRVLLTPKHDNAPSNVAIEPTTTTCPLALTSVTRFLTALRLVGRFLRKRIKLDNDLGAFTHFDLYRRGLMEIPDRRIKPWMEIFGRVNQIPEAIKTHRQV